MEPNIGRTTSHVIVDARDWPFTGHVTLLNKSESPRRAFARVCVSQVPPGGLEQK